jgi:hypothetical protein
MAEANKAKPKADAGTVRVVATDTGFYVGRRRPGDEFEVPKGTTSSWFVPVDAPEDAPEKRVARRRGLLNSPSTVVDLNDDNGGWAEGEDDLA